MERSCFKVERVSRPSAMERGSRRGGYQGNVMENVSQQAVRTEPPCSEEGVSMRRGWTPGFDTDLTRGPVHQPSPKCRDRTLVPSSPGLSRGVPLVRDTDQDFLITQLIQKIEALQLSKGVNAPKKTSSARSPGVHSAHEPAICFNLPESAKVVRYHQNNQLRMLTHRWKMLDLQHSTCGNRDDITFEHRQEKTDDPLKVTAIQTSLTRAETNRKQDNLSSYTSDVGIPLVKVIDKDVPNNTEESIQPHSDDSDLSDQEKERVEVSKWSVPVELDLRPELFENYLDPSYSTETEDIQGYSEALPSALKDLDFTHGLSFTPNSESQQRLLMSDPCLTPMVARLLELEKLQAATVQKERAKPARSRPPTASSQMRNVTRLRNSEILTSKFGGSENAECNSVTCSLTKLTLSSTSSCRCRRDTYPLTELAHGSRGACETLPKSPQTMSGKFNRTANLFPAFPVREKASSKPKTPNRTKRLRTTKKCTPRAERQGSTSAKKTTVAPGVIKASSVV